MPEETPSTPEEKAAEDAQSAAGSDQEAASTAPSAAGEQAGGEAAARKWRLVAGILAVALVAVLVVGVVLWRDRSDLRDQVAASDRAAAAEQAAEEAAVNAMVRMTTYHHKTVDEDYAWVDEVGTPEFEEAWNPARDSAIKLIKAVKARAEGDVINSMAEAVDDSEVRVLLFADQQLFQRGTKQSDLEETRVEMTMVKRGSGWLVDSVEVQNFFANDPTRPDQGSP